MSERLEIENNITGNPLPSLAARISLVCIGLIAILPFLQVHHARPIPAFYTEFVAFALGLLALTLLLSGRYWRNLALPWIVFASLGLFAVLLLQLNLKMPAYYETQVIALLYLVWAMLLIILGSVLRREFGLTAISTALAWFFLAGGELSAAVGVIQHYDIHTFLDDFIAAKNSAAVYGNIGQTNHFANHISLALASLIFLFASRKLRIGVAILLALPLLFVLPLSGSRSPWLYLLALLILSLLLLWQHGRANLQARKLVLAAALTLAGFAFMHWLVQLPWFAGSLGTITPADRMFEQAGGTAIRLYLWREAWQMFLQAPLLGVGFGEYAWHHFQLLEMFRNPEITGVYNNAHNLIMQLLAETGLAGTLPVVGGITVWLLSLRRQPFDLALWWLLALLAIIGIHSMLEFPLWYGQYLGISAFLLGAGETRFLQLPLPRLGRLAMLLSLALLSGLMVMIERDYRQLESIMPAHDDVHKYLSNNDISVLQTLHQKTLLSPYVDFALASKMELNQEKLALKLMINQRVMQFNPSGPLTYKQAILLALNGEHEAALRQAERADSAYPGDLEKFADLLVLLKTENPEALERLVKWADKKIKEKENSSGTK